MNKLQMAHEHIMKSMEKSRPFASTGDLIKWGWEYADKMQAEVDKRNQDSRSLTKDQEGNCLHFHHEFGHKKCMDCGACLEQWQPDWSQAPNDCNYWFISDSVRGVAAWSKTIPCYKGDSGFAVYSGSTEAPLFDYKGDWKDSLRKHP